MIIDLGPLTIKLDVLFVQIINVALLFYFFKKLFGDTLIEEIAKRRSLTLKLEQADKEYDALLSDAAAQKDAILAEALAHKKKLIEEAKNLAAQEKDKIILKAKTDADSIIAKAQKDAELQSRDLNLNFVQWVKSAAAAVVKKLFSHKNDIQESYIEELVTEFTTSYQK